MTAAPARASDPCALLLVVEDEPMVRDLIVMELEDAGFSILEADNGDQAVAILAQNPDVQLLFTDIRLPGRLTGWDIAERARELRPDIPVIYATGYSAGDLRLVEGAIFMKKPYKPSAIVDAVRSLGVTPAC